jgi:hypothetical protein
MFESKTSRHDGSSGGWGAAGQKRQWKEEASKKKLVSFSPPLLRKTSPVEEREGGEIKGKGGFVDATPTSAPVSFFLQPWRVHAATI